MKHKLLLLICLLGGAAQAQFISNTGIEIHNSTTLTTNGDWINDAGTTITNDGTLRTSDAFVNNGTLNASSTGGFILEPATAVNFTPGGAGFSFLELNGAGSVDLALDGELTLSDSLILKNGVLRLVAEPGSPNTPVLRIDAGKKVFAVPTSFVEGTIARSGQGDLFFPLGKDGHYLPITMLQANVQKATATVITAPAGYTAGPGVDSLISFPYAWSVDEAVTADTAAYVEVNYPNTLPKGVNPILAREISGQQYASMGARIVGEVFNSVTVRSYSRRLTGLFTIANGFPADLETDSLALVSLYNETGGAQWPNRENWLVGDLVTWEGVTQEGQSITAVNLPSNNLDGVVPAAVVDIQALQTINLANNQITSIPDFTGNTEITLLDVSNNKLNFASLEPNATVPGFTYANQALLGEPIDSLVEVGSPYEFSVEAGGNSSQYAWKRNGTVVSGANQSTYALQAISRSNMGDYVSTVTNPLLPGLTLTSATHTALAYANVSGQLMVAAATPATKGTMTLFRITPEAYDTLTPMEVNNDGTFTLEKVVLADYQLLGFADTIVHEGVLPTYYKNTIYWEEADTIVLENNVGALNIVSQHEPGPSAGAGTIDGTFYEDDGTGGRTDGVEKLRRIKKAGVSVRRVESSGRGQEEILTLAAYVFTNDLGEFRIPNLPAGDYRINFQYPGYPMDETSFTTITIGSSALESQVSVAATVVEGKVNVKKLIITGVWEPEGYDVHLYPNPAVDNIRMKFGATDPSRTVSILDMTGRTVNSADAFEKEIQIGVSDLKPGMYILRIREKGSIVKTLKLSIE